MSAKTIPVTGQAFLGDDPAVVRAVKVSLGGSTETADQNVTEVTTAQTINLFSVAAGTRVLSLQAQVTTKWFAAVDIAIGDGDNNSLYFPTSTLAATVSDTVPLAATLPAKVYAAADTIDAFVLGTHDAGSDLETGVVEFVLFYVDSLDN